jgi:hypothetical protein
MSPFCLVPFNGTSFAPVSADPIANNLGRSSSCVMTLLISNWGARVNTDTNNKALIMAEK